VTDREGSERPRIGRGFVKRVTACPTLPLKKLHELNQLQLSLEKTRILLSFRFL